MSKVIEQKTTSTTTRRHERSLAFVKEVGQPVYVEFGYTIQETNDADEAVVKESKTNLRVTYSDFKNKLVENGLTSAQVNAILPAMAQAAQDLRDDYEAGTLVPHGQEPEEEP